MGSKPRRPKVTLYAKPKRAPAWWPRKDGLPAWVVVTNTGLGWSLTGSRKDRISIDDVQDAQEIFEMFMERRFRFRAETS